MDTRLAVAVAFAAAVVIAVACGSQDTGTKPAREPAPAAAPAQLAAPVPEAPAPSLPTDGVRALVQRWLAAQNDGDFDAYEPLYAERFYGVKRSGARTYRFDRAGWLRDRERMFGKKMTVSAGAIDINAGPAQAIVRFQQTWASGAFKDVGLKQLVVVDESGELRIAREELLASELVGDGAAGDGGLPTTAFAFALDEGTPFLVIARAGVEHEAPGEPTLLARGTPSVAVKAAAADRLPDAARAWTGREVVLVGALGPVCRGAVVAIEVLAGVEPHFGTLAEWDGTVGESRASPHRIAREVWRMAAGERWLVARVAPSEGACKGALWGRIDDQQLIPRLHDVSGDAALGVAALRAPVMTRFRALKAYKAIQRGFGDEVGSKAPWDGYDGAEPRVAVFYDDRTEARYAAVAATAGAGCGEFYAELWALFQIVPRAGGSELVLLSDETAPGPLFMPEAVVDADADGIVEFVGDGAVARLVGPTYRVVRRFAYPSFDCPC
jgi:hypothetical protein